MIRLPTLFAIALLASSGFVGAQAAPIHKWVDEKGITHYSDQAPTAATTSVTQLDVDTRAGTPQASAQSSGNYYSIANQWQRMNQERLQQRQLDLQRAAINLEAQALQSPAQESAESEPTRYAVAYPQRWHRRHGYKHRRHHGHRAGSRQQRTQTRGSGFPSVIN